MQAKPKIGRILVVLLIVSLVLIFGALTFGGANSTLFNLPSIPVQVRADGAMQAFGFTAGYLPQPTVQQLTDGGIQKLEVRVGHNGAHAYVNGEDMPYLEWNDQSVDTLQTVLRTLPNIPNGDQIASAIPWLRRIGLGATLYLPGSESATLPRWSGETAVTEGAAPETTIGPITIGSLVFDEQGNAMIEGIPADTLAQAGVSLPTLDAGTLAILDALNVDSAYISTTPTGLEIFLDDRPLPRLAYNAEYLQRLSQYLPAFVADPQMLETLNTVLGILPGADLDIAVSFTGEPVAETSLAPINMGLQDDGSLQAFGITVAPAGTVPTDLVENLKAANVQQLSVDIDNEGIFIAANEQILPSITLNDDSAEVVANLAGALADQNPELVSSLLGFIRGAGLHVKVAVPAAEGAEPVEIPDEIDRTMQAADLGEMSPPVVVLNLAYDSNNNLSSIGNIQAADLAALGIDLPPMPPAVSDIMTDLDADQLRIRTEPTQLILSLDGADALALNYDQPSLTRALEVARPFLGDMILTDGSPVSQLILGQILPLAPGAALDLTITRQ